MRAPVSFIFLTVAVANADPEAYTIGQVALGLPLAGGSRTSPAQRLRHRPPPQCRRSYWSRLLWLQPRLRWRSRRDHGSGLRLRSCFWIWSYWKPWLRLCWTFLWIINKIVKGEINSQAQKK